MQAPVDRPFGSVSDDEWLDILIRSVKEPLIDGIEMPRFPHPSVQRRFVGSADENSLREAYNFYLHVKGYANALGRLFEPSMRVLDFGAGWGRLTRFFWRDVGAANLFGVDVDPGIVATATHLGVPGQFKTIENNGRLPFEDGFFDVVIAYSVFTHLPQATADHWMAELHRVTRPGSAIFYTIEPRRFLTFVQGLDGHQESGWHAGLARQKPLIAKLLDDYDAGKFCFIPTGGGEFRDSSVYGDAIIPTAYIDQHWTRFFQRSAYVDDPNVFWQAFVAGLRSV